MIDMTCPDKRHSVKHATENPSRIEMRPCHVPIQQHRTSNTQTWGQTKPASQTHSLDIPIKFQMQTHISVLVITQEETEQVTQHAWEFENIL